MKRIGKMILLEIPFRKILKFIFIKGEKLLINTSKFADWLFSEVIWGHNCKSHYRVRRRPLSLSWCGGPYP